MHAICCWLNDIDLFWFCFSNGIEPGIKSGSCRANWMMFGRVSSKNNSVSDLSKYYSTQVIETSQFYSVIRTKMKKLLHTRSKMLCRASNFHDFAYSGLYVKMASTNSCVDWMFLDQASLMISHRFLGIGSTLGSTSSWNFEWKIMNIINLDHDL